MLLKPLSPLWGAALCALTLAHGAALAAEPVAPYKPSASQLRSLCDTCGIVTAEKTDRRKGKASGVGAVGGAVAGGAVGNSAGDSTAATVGGAVVGGLLGNEIEKRVKRRKVWITTVTLRDGTTRRFEAEADPLLKRGDVVTITNDKIAKR